MQKDVNNNNQEFFGTITDGHYKLDVLLIKNDNEKINVDRGTKLEIIGDLQEDGKILFKLFGTNKEFLTKIFNQNVLGKTFVLQVKNFDYIKVLSGESMELEELLLGSEIFLNKNKQVIN